MSAAVTDPVAFVQAWDDKLNAHDVDGVVALFTPDAAVRILPPPPPPSQEVYSGLTEIRAWAIGLTAGLHVESRDIQQVDDRITWHWSMIADIFRQLGVEHATGTGELALRGDKATAFIATMSAETVATIVATMQAGGNTK